jgi:hypothetical protein
MYKVRVSHARFSKTNVPIMKYHDLGTFKKPLAKKKEKIFSEFQNISSNFKMKLYIPHHSDTEKAEIIIDIRLPRVSDLLKIINKNRAMACTKNCYDDHLRQLYVKHLPKMVHSLSLSLS